MNSTIHTFNEKFDAGLFLANPQKDALAAGITSVPLPTADDLLSVKFCCDSLRDGIQGTFLCPTEKDQVDFIKLQEELGLDALTVGIYTSTRLDNLTLQDKRTLRILEYMREYHPHLDPILVVRATDNDIRFLELCLKKNPNVIALVFQGNSPLRRFVQSWGECSDVLKNLCNHIKQARNLGARVMSFTEDAARTPDNEMEEYVHMTLESDTTWVGIADTVGDFKSTGAYYKVDFVKKCIAKAGRTNGIAYHAHNDSNTAVQSSLAAIAAGAELVAVVVNGVGERAGNADQFQLFNQVVTLLRDYGSADERFDRRKFYPIAKLYEKMTGDPIPDHAPIVGARAFSTSSGVHADAQLKIERELYRMKQDGADESDLYEYRKRLETVYASVSPAEFGRQNDVRLSPMSGAANVILLLYYNGLITEDQMATLPKDHPVVVDLLDYAKRAGKELKIQEIKRRFNDDYWRYFKQPQLVK